MKLIVAVSSKRDARMSFSTLDCHEECFTAQSYNNIVDYANKSIIRIEVSNYTILASWGILF